LDPVEQFKKVQSRIEADKKLYRRFRAPPFVEEVQPSKMVEEMEKVPPLV
jgi:hypothetical protein